MSVGYNDLPNITQAFRMQFQTSVEELLRQQGSLLRAYVNEESLSLGQKRWSQIGGAVAERKDTRHADTTYQELEHFNRDIVADDWFVSLLLDREDEWRCLSQFSNPYSKAIVDALGARIDDTLIKGALLTNYGGTDGHSPIEIPSSQIIAVDYQTGAGTTDQPLTVAKTSTAAKILNQNQVPAYEKRYLWLSANQMDRFIQQEEVANANFNISRALYEGRAPSYSGFEFVLTERIPKDADGNEQLIAYAKPYIRFGVLKDVSTRIDTLPTKHYATQLYGDLSCSAVRSQEAGIVVIKAAP